MPFYLHSSGVLTFNDPTSLTAGSGGFKEYGMNRSRRATFFDRCSLLWYWYSPLNMFTFTIPGKQVEHDLAYSWAFSKLLENLKQNYGVESYVWVAEVQKRGALHFHLVTHKFIDIKWLNAYWCDLIQAYSRNAVDVQHIPNEIDCIPAYLSKYLSKGSNRAIKCRSFGSTRDLKFKPVRLDVPPDNPYGVHIKKFIIDGKEKEIVIRYYNTKRVLSDYFQI